MTDMPSVAVYRGVRLHAFQSQERIDQIVKPAIDAAWTIGGVDDLWIYLQSVAHPPEARLLAGARLKAISETAADKRLPRPEIKIDRIDAVCAALGSLNWASLDCYASDLDPDSSAAPRPAEFQKQLAEYQRRAGLNVPPTEGANLCPA